MTMFTEGRLQAYERMTHQTYMSRGRDHDHGSKNQNVNRDQSKNNSKQLVKGGVRRGSYQS